jgi:hypothetical protein
MSLILDALKKLDREKAFIRKVSANIADEILKPDPVRPRKKFLLYFAGGLLTVCVTAALTYVATVNVGFLAKTVPPAPSSAPGIDRNIESSLPSQESARRAQDGNLPSAPKGQNFAVTRKPSDPEAIPVPPPKILNQPGRRAESAPPLREPARGDQEGIPPASSRSRKSAESKKPAETASSPTPKPGAAMRGEGQVESLPSSQAPAKETQERTPSLSGKVQDSSESRKSSPLPVEKKAGEKMGQEGAGTGPAEAKEAAENRSENAGAAPSDLRLTGIVWSEDPSGRCAVINGAILTEGAEIQGVKVVEILPNRVRLREHGRVFEIQLF